MYPFTVLALGLALLVGDGAAAGFSIALGKGDKKQANKNVGNGLVILFCLALGLCAIGFICQTQILGLFGGNPAEAECYGYATDYFKIICAGIPFYMIGQGLNGSIRADGSPKFAMACTLAGAITNLIFDPVLIFGFNMGVKGAAIATIMGQILTFAMSVIYLSKAKNFTIGKEVIKLDGKTSASIVSVGMASLIVQLSIVIIIAVNNNLLTKYGYDTFASTGEAFGAVVLLDEATASLDVENETLIQTALSRLIADKTVLVIAHRMRTVAGADKIVVLSDGTVAEEGSPKELAEKNGVYANMVKLQTENQSWKLE